MIAKGQSAQAQDARLAMQFCPVHGAPMGQVSSWLSFITERHEPNDYAREACPRSDCDIVAKMTKAAFDTEGPAIVVTAADVHPDLWAQAAGSLAHKRARGVK